MRHIAITAQFQGEAAAPAGEPPQTDPRATSVSMQATTSDGSPFELDRASISAHAVYTGESTFTETGTISFGDGGDELEIVSVGEGTLGPSADPELLNGAVMYRIARGHGRFEGASGLITSNFVLRPATGKYEEHQVLMVFLS